MSGGSFNYASLAGDMQEVIEKRYSWRELMDAMEDNGADDVAAEIRVMLDQISIAERRVRAHLDRLDEVARALEWWKSCDYSEDQFRAALDTYRSPN